jgi:hypothetical protein
MKFWNKFFGVLICVLSIAVTSESFAKCKGNDIARDLMNDQTYGCNCNNGGVNYDRVKNGYRVFGEFPNLKRCSTGIDDRWVDESGEGKLCQGFKDIEKYNKNKDIMELVAERVGDTAEAKCWKWKCKSGTHAFKVNNDGSVDVGVCVLATSPELINPNTNALMEEPCDLKSTMSVRIGDTTKIVRMFVLVDNKCMAVCPAGTASGALTDVSDPTEIKIMIQ